MTSLSLSDLKGYALNIATDIFRDEVVRMYNMIGPTKMKVFNKMYPDIYKLSDRKLQSAYNILNNTLGER